jgi:hypothetical protein
MLTFILHSTHRNLQQMEPTRHHQRRLPRRARSSPLIMTIRGFVAFISPEFGALLTR